MAQKKGETTLGLDISLCRALLNTNDEQLNDEFNVRYDSHSLENKLKIVNTGVMELALDIIRKDSPKHVRAIYEAWNMFMSILVINDVDDENEQKPIDAFTDMGGIELAAREFERRLKRSNRELLLTFAWCATNDKATVHIVQSGVHKYAIDMINAGADDDDFDTAMSFIRTCSACPSTRTKLREDGALDAVIPYLEGLKRPDEDHLSLRRGFRAASVVARLAGNDEAGPMVQLLRGNPILITRTVEVLDKVLDAGPKGTVWNMLVNPHFITMDLLTISTSDVNKPLLKGAIPVLIKALRLRGQTNEAMVVDIVLTLLQLTYDPECLTVMMASANEIVKLLESYITAKNKKYDREALMSSLNLQNVLVPPPQAQAAAPAMDEDEDEEEESDVLQDKLAKPAPKAPSRLAGLLRRAVKEKPVALAAPAAAAQELPRRKSVTIQADEKHVFLSYNWGVKDIVHRVDELLRTNGIKTWLDDRDMGPNLNDSMAIAIEGASMVFVFMTAKYKESANCRKECEYADEKNVPIAYIMAQDGYKPNGWLGLQLGKAIWIPCWSVDLAQSSLSTMLDRAKPGAGSKIKTEEANSTSSSTTSSSVPSSSGNNSDILELLKAMQQQMGAMQQQMKTLTQAVEDIKTDVKKALEKA